MSFQRRMMANAGAADRKRDHASVSYNPPQAADPPLGKAENELFALMSQVVSLRKRVAQAETRNSTSKHAYAYRSALQPRPGSG